MGGSDVHLKLNGVLEVIDMHTSNLELVVHDGAGTNLHPLLHEMCVDSSIS